MGCWIAPRDVLPGTIYAEEIINAIEYTDALVLICSRHTGDSVHVRSEVEHAFSRKKVIFPVRMDDADLGKALEYFLGTSHWLAAWDSPIEECVERLAESIIRVLDSESEGPGAQPAIAPDSVQEVRREGDQREHPNNLPAQTTSLIGREKEVAEVVELLKRDDVRLVTLTGPGGTGKTRIALQAASVLLDEFEDGVFFVDLAPILDPNLMVSTIAGSLDINYGGGQPIVQSVLNYLRGRKLLLLLDNLEQIIAAAPGISNLLQSCSKIKVLVTSRIALRLSGDHEYAVSPLAAPDYGRKVRDRGVEVKEVSTYTSVLLFVERAAAIKPGFELNKENASDIAEICFRVDGLPLAIELAVARLRSLTPRAMVSRLEQRLPLLDRGARDLPNRQKALQSTIQWSYDLLNDEEKALFRRLGVFVGGCTLEAAEAVCSDSSDSPFDVLHVLDSLLESNLLIQRDMSTEPRYFMLETVRDFAARRLRESDKLKAVERSHGDYFFEYGSRAEPQLHGANQLDLMNRMKNDVDNFRAVLEWARRENRRGPAIEFLCSTFWFWHLAGLLSEIGHRLRGFLTMDARISNTVSAKGLCCQSAIESMMGNLDESARVGTEALPLVARIEDSSAKAWAYAYAGNAAYFRGDFAEAEGLIEESLSLSRSVGYQWGLTVSTRMLGFVKGKLGDYGGAYSLFGRSMVSARKMEDRISIAYLLRNSGRPATI